MFYQIMGCVLFATLALAVTMFAAVKEDKPKRDLANLEKVERSLCCHAPVVQGLVRPGTRLDPAEYDDFCGSCGRQCEVGDFLRDPVDGMLIDVEMGEEFEEGCSRDLDFGGPDPDLAYEAWREDHPRRRS